MKTVNSYEAYLNKLYNGAGRTFATHRQLLKLARLEIAEYGRTLSANTENAIAIRIK